MDCPWQHLTTLLYVIIVYTQRCDIVRTNHEIREGTFAKGDGGENVREGTFAKGDGGENVREGTFEKGDLQGHRINRLVLFYR